MHEYDKSSKWLIQHHGNALLRLGGTGNVVSWRPLQAEVVQPRKLCDGLLDFKQAKNRVRMDCIAPPWQQPCNAFWADSGATPCAAGGS
jgi:hypothetical protein